MICLESEFVSLFRNSQIHELCVLFSSSAQYLSSLSLSQALYCPLLHLASVPPFKTPRSHCTNFKIVWLAQNCINSSPKNNNWLSSSSCSHFAQLLHPVGRLEIFREGIIQASDDFVDGFLPGLLLILSWVDGFEKFSQCGLYNSTEWLWNLQHSKIIHDLKDTGQKFLEREKVIFKNPLALLTSYSTE